MLCIVAAIAASPSAHAAQVIAGNAHSLQLRDDGTLWSWGANTNGQLGDGTKVTKSTTVQVLTGVRTGAAGFAHTLAVKADGRLWVWGGNSNGQLGDGTTIDKSSPTPTLANVRAVFAGGSRSHAIKNDNSLWSWGFNGAGQLGNGTKISTPVPIQVLTNVQAVAAGGSHTLALKNDGTLWVWGSNSSGQLGDGSTVDKPTPFQILSGIRAVAAGVAYSLALKNDGSVWAWGNNSLGQLGDGSTTNRPSPVMVMTGIDGISAGGYHSLALKTDGTLFVWGNNLYGQIGDGTTTNRPLPTQVQAGIVGMIGGNAHTIAIKSDGTLLTWGNNADGQLGDGSTVSRSTPFHVLNDGQDVAAGVYHSAALKRDGTIWAWGDNFFGQLGTGKNASTGTPAQVLDGARAVATGQYHTVALRADNSVWTWGFNAYGQLGDGGTVDRNMPAQVLTGVRAVAAGANHSLAIKSDGSLWVWGNNLNGQVGDGSTNSHLSPVQIMTGVVAVAGGSQHSVAIKTDGSVWTWGSNKYGQLGDSTTVDSRIPMRILAAGGQAVAAGGFHSLAIKTDGTLWAWGLNSRGQIGDGSTQNKSTPIQVLTKVQSVVAGQHFNIARKTDGSVWTWGANQSGTLGPGAAGPYNSVPSENAYLRNSSVFAGGAEHAIAVDAVGQVVTWGDNSNQQLGISRKRQSPTPTPPADPVTPFAGTVLVVEFFNPTILNGAGNPGIGHYFITASASEAAGIDAGLAGPGWQRTGRTFRAWADVNKAPSDAASVCRFYARAPNSHFYTGNPEECQSLRNLNPGNDPNLGWAYEGIAFYGALPVKVGCPAGFNPVYRSYNNRYSPNAAQNDGNHRLTPSLNDHLRAVKFFGYADEEIALCSPQNSTSAGADLQATFTYPGAMVQNGAPLVAEFTFSNNGPGKADGSGIHAVLPPEVTNWVFTCTPSGGAVCPTELIAAALRSGLRVATWPAGGVLTLKAIGTAPTIASGAEPSLTFAASVASASGNPDPNPANDTPPVSKTIVKAPATCNLAFNPPTLSLGPAAQPVNLGIIAGANCSWVVQARPSWLAISADNGTDDSTLVLQPVENTDSAARTGNLVISGKAIVVTQAGTPLARCGGVRLQRNGDQVTAVGLTGSTSFTVYAENQCVWSAQVGVPWIKVVSGASGKGNGAVSYIVERNDDTVDRFGEIDILGTKFTVKQAKSDGTGPGTDGQGGGDSGGDGGDGGGDGGGGDGGGSE